MKLERASGFMGETIGEKICRLMKERNITSWYQLSELTKKTGIKPIDQGALKKIGVGENKNPTPKTLRRIASALNIDPGYLISEDGSNKKSQVSDLNETVTKQLNEVQERLSELKQSLPTPEAIKLYVRGSVPAGTARVIEAPVTEDNYVIVLSSVLEKFPHFADIYPLRITGESLAGDGIHEGDAVLILPVTEVDINRKIYVCETEEGQVIKRVERLPDGRYQLVSSNSEYKTYEPGRLKIIGRAVYVVSGHNL